MTSPAFLLALAPAATAVASQTVTAVKKTGESFVSVLGNMLETPAANTTTSVASKPSLSETVQSLAKELRCWLSERGAGDEYSIDYHLAADGEYQLDVSGDSADHVKHLLASDSSWVEKLRQLATAMQAKSAQLSRDYSAPSVTIAIDQHDANVN